MKYFKCFASGILAGIFIAFGGLAFVVSVNAFPSGKIIGSVLFSCGLMLVCSFKVNLYTGKIGFALKQEKSYVLDLVFMLLGNLVGAVTVGYLIYLASGSESSLIATAESVAGGRLVGDTETWYKALIMSIFCGMLVYLAVSFFNKMDNPFLKVIGLVFAVTVFVVTGMEHCIANMFYFSCANAWNLNSLLNVLICIVGNSIGALVLDIMFSFITSDKKA